MSCKEYDNKGFSLVELIIIILIIGILSVLIVPRIISYVSAGQKNVCQNNMVEIENCYDRLEAEGKGVSLSEVVRDSKEEYFNGKLKCPTNGDYVAAMAEDGSRRTIVCCTKHSDGIHKVNVQTVFVLEKLMGMTAEEKREYLGIDNNNVSNDTIRAKILELLGGQYEGLSESVQTKMTDKNKSQDLYVKPMITHDSNESHNRDKYVLYVNNKIDDTGTNLWIANAIFDPQNGKWYEYVNPNKPNYNLALKKYDEVMNEILVKNPDHWKVLN